VFFLLPLLPDRDLQRQFVRLRKLTFLTRLICD
jgi:hypothetical protein